MAYTARNNGGGGNRFRVSKAKLRSSFFVLAYSLAVFARFWFMAGPVSFDYDFYIQLIEALSQTSIHDMVGIDLFFPYVAIGEITPVEVGFSFLLKLVSFSGLTPEFIFAFIASISVGLRVCTMEALRVPRIWIFLLNVFAITLFDANALRLGIASSVLLFGLFHIRASRRVLGLSAVGLSALFHLQVVLFIIPFLAFYLFPNWTSQSRIRVVISLALSSAASWVLSQLIPLSDNEKVIQYVSRGGSESAGVSVTSVLAVLLLILAALAARKRGVLFREGGEFWTAILFAVTPSVILLIFVTDIAVIGDRAWQLAFFILATFFFVTGNIRRKLDASKFVLFALYFVMMANILIRYPLSNFFSPPFPALPYNAGI